eukprot:COSAG06_NODE_24_length_32981_cov_25.509671_28_plen_289_part_00
MYTLTPHNYVAFSLANRLRAWRRTFLGLAAIQIVVDFASCFALATLVAGGISAQKTTPTALIIGYFITSFGFLLFFGPLSVASSLRGGLDQAKSRRLRCALTVAGVSLLCALSYILLLFIMLISGTNVFCGGWTFQSDPCNGRGTCYGASQCHCELGFGPELSFTGEPLCSRDHSPCTGDQLQRALAAGDNTCCFGHGGREFRSAITSFGTLTAAVANLAAPADPRPQGRLRGAQTGQKRAKTRVKEIDLPKKSSAPHPRGPRSGAASGSHTGAATRGRHVRHPGPAL